MTNPVLVSPLKTSSDLNNSSPLPRRSGAVRALFQDEPVKPESKPLSLSEKYNCNLDSPGLFGNSNEFFDIRNAVEAIDNRISDDDALVIEFVRKTLTIQEHKVKMAELGMALFYLDRDASIPNEESLTHYRAAEINQEVQSYIQQHKEAGVSPIIPSGKTHYILRAIAHMVATSEQRFNKGGLFAINRLLTEPELMLSQFLQPEHRQHMLVIAATLLKDPALQQIIERNATVHKDLENLIRLDLKLHPEQPVLSAHVIYDVLMALFSDVRQKDDPNCYAIASLIYTAENYTFKFFETKLKWLSQGHVTISDQFTLPLKPLVDKRLVYYHDLTCRVEYENALTIAPFEHIKAALSLNKESRKGIESPTTVRGSLTRLLHENQASTLLPYAEQLYVAYKCNTLNMLHLAVIEMTYMNGSSSGVLGFRQISNFKRSFVNMCLNAIQAASRNPRDYSPAFLAELSKRLNGKIWLENCNEQKVDVIGRSVLTQTRQIRQFEGDPNALSRVFYDSLRVFAFDGKTFKLIDKVSELQREIMNAVAETQRALEPSCKGSYRATRVSMEDAIHSHVFRIKATNYCASEINRRGIKGVHLNRADLLLLRQIGGEPSESLKLVYNIDVTKVRINNCHTPYKLIENLLAKIPTFDQAIFSSTPKVMLFTPGHHIWTLNPNSWRILLANDKFYQFIQETVFNPVRQNLKRRIPRHIVQKVIDTYQTDPQIKLLLENEFLQEKLTYQAFMEQFQSCPLVGHTSKAKEAINQCFSEIHLSKKILSHTLRRLGITLTTRQFNQLYDTLPQEGVLPYILARKLRQRLIEQKISIPHHYDIERALCQANDQPISFIIGDSNWLQKNTEDPYHLELCIGYDWVKNTLVIKTRYKDRERIEDQKSYREVEIQYPPVLLQSDREEKVVVKV